jgi:hypothetical protein
MLRSNAHLRTILWTLGTAVIILICICLFIHFSERYSFGSEIDGVGVLSLAVTVALAIIISIVLAKKDEAERNDKSFIIDDFKSLKEALHAKSETLLAPDNLKLEETVSGLSVLKQGIHTFVDLAKEYKFIEQSNIAATELADAFTSFERLFTDTGDVPAANGSRVVIQANKITLDLARKDAVRKTLTKIDALILKISIEINRS